MDIDQTTVDAVWKKGMIVGSNDSDVWRQDECGAWMQYSKYGDRGSQYGWEVDHIVSQDHGGSDALSNLRPLQWQNNTSKSSGRLKCAVKAEGKDNKSV